MKKLLFIFLLVMISRVGFCGPIALAGTGGGGKILRSTDYGVTWSDLGQQFSQSDIFCMCYLDNDIALAGTYIGGKILRSTDRGATWSDMGQLGTETYVKSLCYLGNGIVLAGTQTGGKIFRSIDYGVNWSDLGQQFSETRIYALCNLGGGIALAGTGALGKILRSTDYGATWSDLGQQFSETRIFSLCSLGGGIALAGTGYNGKILRSTDSGATWSDLGQQHSVDTVRSLCSLGNGIALAGTSILGKILRSADSGATWSDIGQLGGESQVNALTYMSNGIVLAGTQLLGKIFRSVNYGLNWTDIGQQFSQTYIFGLCCDVCDEEVYVNFETGGDDFNHLGDLTNDDFRSAVQFTTETEITCTSASVYLGLTNDSPTGDLTLRIETDDTSLPSDILVHANATGVLPFASISTPAWNKADFTPFTLPAGTYWLVISIPIQARNDRYGITCDTDGVGRCAEDINLSGWTGWTNEFMSYYRIYKESGGGEGGHPTTSQLLNGGLWYNSSLKHSDWCRFKRGTDE